MGALLGRFRVCGAYGRSPTLSAGWGALVGACGRGFIGCLWGGGWAALLQALPSQLLAGTCGRSWWALVGGCGRSS